MAINKLMRSALKALSAPDINTKKNFKTERAVVNITHRHVFRPSYKIWDHRIFAEDHDIPVRLYSPAIKGRFPVIIFFHGGGWVTGNMGSYDKLCTVMAERTGHMVVSVEYRLAPEHPFPAGLYDCYLVTKEIFGNPDLLNVTSEQITLVGDSAGGNLAAAVSLMARDKGDFTPRRQILLYPSTYNNHNDESPFSSVRENGTDYLLTQKRINDYMELYSNNAEDLMNPYFAPLISGDLSNQPDTLILTAEFDPLRDEGEAYGHKLRAFGNKVEIHRMADALHGYLSLNPRFRSVQDSYRIINKFLKGVTVE